MHREGHLMEEITAYPNMEESFRAVVRGSRRKGSRTGRALLAHKEEVIAELSARLADGSYTISNYHEMEVMEAGKLRRIQVLPMKDRIAIHAVMNVVDGHLRRRFIRTTAASIKGRGMHDLLGCIRSDMEADPEGTVYCYKLDVRKYYESVSQDRLMECVRRVFKDRTLLMLLERFVRMMPSGISIGLRSSQGLGNLFLSDNLDHHVKDKCGVPYYYRYCDDIVVLGKAKSELWKVRDIIHGRLSLAGLEVKPNERIFPVSEGIDFLGYVIRPGYTLLRKRVKQNFARKMHDIQSKRRKRELTASFYGMAKHADSIRLFNKLTGKEMRDFKSLNVSYKPEDGKKRFPGTVVSIRELVNLPIVVKDFETGIKTEQGEDRCIVAIELNGEPRKFFTNSEEMKNILAQIREIPDGFPFETTIRTESFGKGRTKYVFS